MVARRPAVAGVALVLAAAFVLDAAFVFTAGFAHGQPPARDAGAQTGAPARDAARVSGRIIAADTGKPVRRASIVIAREGGPDPRLLGPGSYGTSSGDDGMWQVEALQPGRYHITVSKAGYVATQYGQRHPRERARLIDIRPGTTLEHIDVRLPKAGAIAGRIVDDNGEPVSPGMVTAMQVRYVNGERTLAPVTEGVMSILRGGLTDDRGEYRIHGLSPGTYYVSTVVETMGTPPGSSMQLAPTFYPGTPSIAAAQPVILGAGEDALDISFTMARVRVARVAGTVVNASGAPARATLRLTSTARLAVGGQMATDAAGAFNLPAIPPGDYRLEVQSSRDGVTELGLLHLSVGGEDITGLVIATTPPGSASGRVVTDDGSPLPAGVGVEAAAMTTETFSAVSMGRRSVDANGHFEIRGLLDRYAIRVMPPEGWFPRSVMMEGKDIIDSGHEFRAREQVAGIEVTITRRGTLLRGSALDDSNAPIADCTVVVFSTDERRWTRQTRYVQTVRPNETGQFTLRGLPADEYFVVAFDYVEPGEDTDPAHLERWKHGAARVTLSDEEPATVTLRGVRSLVSR